MARSVHLLIKRKKITNIGLPVKKIKENTPINAPEINKKGSNDTDLFIPPAEMIFEEKNEKNNSPVLIILNKIDTTVAISIPVNLEKYRTEIK